MDDPQAMALDRIRRAAFNITSTFEGSKTYANYQNYDAGIISYGRFQFTLSGGALVKVVNYYLASASSDTANQLRGYQARIQARDGTLRDDETLKNLLIAAAAEPAMQAAQDRVVMESYWVPCRDSITSRGIVTPLGMALLFDMAVQHGPANKLTQTAEAQLGAPPKSMLGQNGLNEQQLITQVANVRHDYLVDFAAKNNLPGVVKRADFWVALVAQTNWQLQGDAGGNVNVYSRPVQVKNPPGPTVPDPTFKPTPAGSPTTGAITSAPASPGTVIPVTMPDFEPHIGPVSGGAPGSTPPADSGLPVGGTFITNQVLPVYETPSTSGVLMGRVMEGKQLSVVRQYAPSPDEEWLLTDVGWIARRLPSAPGQVFGDFNFA